MAGGGLRQARGGLNPGPPGGVQRAACSVVASVNPSDTSVVTGSDTTSSSATTNEATPVATASASVEEALSENSEIHEDADDYVWDSATVVSIGLNGNSITVDGEGVTVDGSTATISL